jgi:hypothetical protein
MNLRDIEIAAARLRADAERVGEILATKGIAFEGLKVWHGITLRLILPGVPGVNPTRGDPFGERPDLLGKRRVCVTLATGEAVQKFFDACATGDDPVDVLRSNDASGGWSSQEETPR